MSDQRVRWGILSTARIGETAFIPAVRQTDRGEIVAVASRDGERARAYARKHQIPGTFDSYAEMLESDRIDAVYNPLPNTLHAEWTEIAAANGKHVFCEKPLAASSAAAKRMVGACREAGVLLAEAFVFLVHPQTQKLRRLLDDGTIGELLQLDARLTFSLARPSENIRLNKELGGGAMLDAGGYPVTFARFAFGADPVGVQAAAYTDPDYHVDSRVAMVLTFPGNRLATLQTGLDAQGGQWANLYGSEGWIEIPFPYHPREQSSFIVHTRDGDETHTFETGRVPFTAAVEEFHAAVLDGAPLRVPADNAIGTLRTIEAVLESAGTGRRIGLT